MCAAFHLCHIAYCDPLGEEGKNEGVRHECNQTISILENKWDLEGNLLGIHEMCPYSLMGTKKFNFFPG